MTKALLVILSTVLIAACNNSQSENTNSGGEPVMQTDAPVVSGPKDPVCDMPKEAGWTEYSVNGTDTTWFCSETCKTAYEGNPNKYQPKTSS